MSVPEVPIDTTTLLLKKTLRRVHLLVINCLSAGSIVAVLTLSQSSNVLLFSIIPIVIVGWFFSKRAVVLTTLFMYSVESLYILGSDKFPISSVKDMLPGIFTHSFFATIALMIHTIKAMSIRIQNLNEQLIKKNRELEVLAVRDPLTNLYNRRYAQTAVFEYAKTFLLQLTTPEVENRNAAYSDKSMILLLADIDNFKQFNDTYGHAVGDRVLIEVSRRIQSAVRFDDIVIRWGGEEFLIVCPLAKRNYLNKIVEKVLNSIRCSSVAINKTTNVTVTISLGAICFPVITSIPTQFAIEKAIILCDKALYTAKQGGRNQACYILPNKPCNQNSPLTQNLSVDSFFSDTACCSVHTIR